MTDPDIDVLKQPLQTSITIDNLEFEDFKVEERLHVGISVKDFKAIVTHAETLKTSITALYSFPTKPMQLSYREHGMQCEFTLMTIGDYRANSVTPSPAAVRQVPAAPAEKPPSPQSDVHTAVQRKTTTMSPQSQPLSRSFTRESQSQRIRRPSPPPPKASSLNPESLFLPADEDDDRLWGERKYDDEQDTLGWDASANNVNPLAIIPAYQLTGKQDPSLGGQRSDQENSSRLPPYPAWQEDPSSRIGPTQNISEACRNLQP